MKPLHRRARAALPFALLAGLAAAPAAAATLVALSTLQPGRWEVSGEGVPTRSLCLADPAALVQVRHGAAACSRFVIEDRRRGAVVHYSCPGAGWGQTSLKLNGDGSVRIDTQGIADNAPFAFTAKARRVGSCGSLALVKS